MKLKVLFPAVAFLSLLMLFGLAGSTFLSLSPVSPAYAQNGAPVFPEVDENDDEVDYTRTVDENKGPYVIVDGTDPEDDDRVLIGDPVTATGDDVTYSLENAGTSDFAIDYFTGQLLVGTPLDYERQSTYTVNVRATDSSDRTTTQEVTINVANVDEAGKVNLRWIPASNNAVQFIAELTDPDGEISTAEWVWKKSESSNCGSASPFDPAVETPTYTANANHNLEYLCVTATYTDPFDLTNQANETVSKTQRVEINQRFQGKNLSLTGSDGSGYDCSDQDTDTICVNVPSNSPPGKSIYYPSRTYYGAESEDLYPNRGRISYFLSGGRRQSL